MIFVKWDVGSREYTKKLIINKSVRGIGSTESAEKKTYIGGWKNLEKIVMSLVVTPK